jgi:large subunit ribosomal protein L18
MSDKKLALTERRRKRLRYQLRQKSGGRPRLSVFRSGKHIYAQVIDDKQGITVAAASSIEKPMRETLKTGADKDAATAVGKLVAERALAAGIVEVVFDRGPYIYHGRVKALAEAAREGGLSF